MRIPVPAIRLPLASLLLATTVAAPTPPVKVFVSADTEGVVGTVTGDRLGARGVARDSCP